MLLSIFSGGLIAIDVFLLALLLWFAYSAIKAHNSGTETGGTYGGGGIRQSGAKMPYHKLPDTKYAAAVVVAWIITIIARAADL